jgi:hypothetical protein
VVKDTKGGRRSDDRFARARPWKIRAHRIRPAERGGGRNGNGKVGILDGHDQRGPWVQRGKEDWDGWIRREGGYNTNGGTSVVALSSEGRDMVRAKIADPSTLNSFNQCP